MLRALRVPYAELLAVSGIGLLFRWLRLPGGTAATDRLARARLALSRRFRPRPDPGLEMLLRAAFADLDRELAAILGDPVSGDRAA